MSAGSETRIRLIVALLWQSIESRLRRQLISLAGLIVASAAIETLLIASFALFLGKVLVQDGASGASTISELKGRILGRSVSAGEAGLLLALSSVVASATKLWITKRASFYSAEVATCIGDKAFKNVLASSLESTMSRDVDRLITTLTLDISRCVSGLNGLILCFSCSLSITAVTSALVAENAPVALALGSTLALAYIYIGKKTKPRITGHGKRVTKINDTLIETVRDTIGSFRDIKLEGYEDVMHNRFHEYNRRLRFSIAANNVVSLLPRYSVEGISFSLIGIVCAIAGFSDTTDTVVPTLAVMALGAQRLLPTFQMFYSGWAALSGSSASIRRAAVLARSNEKVLSSKSSKKDVMKLEDSILLTNIEKSFGTKKVLNGVNMEIKKGEWVGLTGDSGSGKSTLLDIVSGLVTPSSGEIEIDRRKVYVHGKGGKVNDWKQIIGYVPQDVYMLKGSIRANIVMGETDIDEEHLVRCCKISLLKEMIMDSRKGWETLVGERGGLISGGQKQRVGIARALYRRPQLLIVDEATSGIDTGTEMEIFQSIKRECSFLSLIVVSHKKESFSMCDRVYQIKKEGILEVADHE